MFGILAYTHIRQLPDVSARALFYVVLYCFMLVYVVLCCVCIVLLLFYVVLCCFMLFYVVSYFLCCFTLFYVVLCCFMLFYVVLCCFILFYVVLMYVYVKRQPRSRGAQGCWRNGLCVENSRRAPEVTGRNIRQCRLCVPAGCAQIVAKLVVRGM